MLGTLFVECTATCTSITCVKGELIGDPLDVKMFEATEWLLDETHRSETGDDLILANIYPRCCTNS